jgi:hypothetical protein
MNELARRTMEGVEESAPGLFVTVAFLAVVILIMSSWVMA